MNVGGMGGCMTMNGFCAAVFLDSFVRNWYEILFSVLNKKKKKNEKKCELKSRLKPQFLFRLPTEMSLISL